MSHTVSLRARCTRALVRFTLRPIFANPHLTVEQRRKRLLRLTALTNLLLPRRVRFETRQLGGVPVEWARGPADRGGVLLYLHGGAYIIGSPAVFRPLTAQLALDGEFAVATPDYRLAPEHPYPAAVDDALAAYLALREQHPNTPIYVGGDSAGGNLTLALLLRLRDEGHPLPRAAFVISPWTDLACELPAHQREAARDAVLFSPALREAGEHYAGGRPLNDPGLSPLYADPVGLPPLLVQGTDAEVLSDDARTFVERARAAGVAVQHREWQDLWHDWQLFVAQVPESRAAVLEIARFLREPRR